MLRWSAQVKIASLDQRSHLLIGYRARQHPESAIGMNPVNARLAQDTRSALDALSDYIRRLDDIVFDVDDAYSERNVLAQIAEDLQFIVAPPGKL